MTISIFSVDVSIDFSSLLLRNVTGTEMKPRLLVCGAAQIVQVCDTKQTMVTGEAMKKIAVFETDDCVNGGYGLVVNE